MFKKLFSKETESELQREAVRMLKERKFKEAVTQLLEIAGRAPKDYKHIWTDDEGTEHINCWSLAEFSLYVFLIAMPEKRRVKMDVNAYPSTCCMLGIIFLKFREYDRARDWIVRGLRLEPDQPALRFWLGLTFLLEGKPGEAIGYFNGGLVARLYILPSVKAALLRAKGSALIEGEKYDEAIACLKESQTIEPDNAVAKTEMEYTTSLQSGEEKHERTFATMHELTGVEHCPTCHKAMREQDYGSMIIQDNTAFIQCKSCQSVQDHGTEK